jgi:hypothetical protein
MSRSKRDALTLKQSTDACRGGFVVSGGHHAMEADTSSTGGREARERGET